MQYYSKPPQAGTDSIEGVDLRGRMMFYISVLLVCTDGWCLKLLCLTGELHLQGSTIAIDDEVQLNITKGDKKNAKVTTLKTASDDEAVGWFSVINSEIVRRNIMALQNGSRAPEIVSWYYKYQEDMYNRTVFLETEIDIELIYFNAGKPGDGRAASSKFLIGVRLK